MSEHWHSRRAWCLVVLALGAALAQVRKPPETVPSPAPGTLAAARGRWGVRYFYDQSKSTLSFHDLCFPGTARGVAVGVIQEGSRHKAVGLVTADGGAHWQTVALEEPPVSLYFLNENAGWMVTTGGLWKTEEAGKTWHKVRGFPSGMWSVHFLDEENGFAAGSRKRAYRTSDGGRHWTLIGAAAEPPGEARYSSYNWIAFATPRSGLIGGVNTPPSRFGPEFPAWMDPEGALHHREIPHLLYTLTTTDGGKTWKAGSSSLFGLMTRVRLGTQGRGLGLIEYGSGNRWASEVYQIDWTTGRSVSVYRDRQFAISDLWLTADGTAYLSGVRTPGELRGVVPGKVEVLESRKADYSAWSKLDVDYRAVANRTRLAASPDGGLWMATDSGMILKLER